ncbi:MAG: FKBP-type peptidyl-prolyl cis-trans isomerase [Bacteroidetes bacterium]|nr:FKBP-type peptidyl-prolyl cis-trans isomerase [Bacteroidota bacterium]MDA1122073.1 FKBP-type peptidyl-prolyl cis-trans isomerase [Bacteroidota bacterium]
MKIIREIIAFAVIAMMLSCAQKSQDIGSNAITLASKADTLNYCIGLMLGNNYLQMGIQQKIETELDMEIITTALSTMLTEGPTLIPTTEALLILDQRYNDLKEERLMKIYDEGVEFLDQNKQKNDVNTTESGLQYKIIKKGAGPFPTIYDEVTVHYHGTFVDGTVFGSTQGEEPVTLPVNAGIKGWTEALQLMPLGSKWILYMPSEIGYGLLGNGSNIPPNAALIFELELIHF